MYYFHFLIISDLIYVSFAPRKSLFNHISLQPALRSALNHQYESSITFRVSVGLTVQSVRWLWRARRSGSPIPSVGSAWSNTGCKGPRAPSALWCWSSGELESRCWGSWCAAAAGDAWPGTPNHLEETITCENIEPAWSVKIHRPWKVLSQWKLHCLFEFWFSDESYILTAKLSGAILRATSQAVTWNVT